MGGSIPIEAYWKIIKKADFAKVTIVARRTLTPQELEAMACCPGEEFTPDPAKEDLAFVQGKVVSVKFTAIKPEKGASDEKDTL